MNYEETLNYLYTCAPLFQQVGAHAYKPGLQTTLELDSHFGNPHQTYPVIHIGGTNGKGSCASTIAAILQEAGYKVGLYTSPHLVDFRERIRVNGEMIPQQRVVRFVEEERYFFEPLHPSFFELTTALAFLYFQEQGVDVAVVEVGLGGRLDCTNIVRPILSIVTNISLDHTQFLGNSLQEIAGEKAGIIKPNTPVVVGETCFETRHVFEAVAQQMQAPIVFAEEKDTLLATKQTAQGILYTTSDWGTFLGELSGSYQVNNARTIFAALPLIAKYFEFTSQNVCDGFSHVCRSTGLKGRWQILGRKPLIIVDAGHNEGGWAYLHQQIIAESHGSIHIVLGTSADKDIERILKLLPPKANYYFTKASVSRALDEKQLRLCAEGHGLYGDCYATVSEAFCAAKSAALPDDLIFIGGSCFVVADFLQYWKKDMNNAH